MITNITAKIDGNLITFVSSNKRDWYVSSVSPNTEGVYPITLTINTDNGLVYTYSADDADFGEYLKLYVTNHESNLINYLPHIFRKSQDFKAICDIEDDEVNILYPTIDSIFADSLIMYCSEERLSEWEKALKIIPTGSLDERRYFLKASLRGSGKLNEAKIKSIVEAFTGGGSIVTFEDSTIHVKILPPNNGEIYRFPDVERVLQPLIPAHLNLSVVRYYSIWDNIKTNYASWNTVSQATDWNAIKNWIAP